MWGMELLRSRITWLRVYSLKICARRRDTDTYEKINSCQFPGGEKCILHRNENKREAVLCELACMLRLRQNCQCEVISVEKFWSAS